MKKTLHNQHQFDFIYHCLVCYYRKSIKNCLAIETILKINNDFFNGNKKEEVFMSEENKGKKIDLEDIRKQDIGYGKIMGKKVKIN